MLLIGCVNVSIRTSLLERGIEVEKNTEFYELLSLAATMFVSQAIKELKEKKIGIARNSVFTMYLEDQRDAVLSSFYLLYCQVTLYVSGVSRAHHQEYTNCSYNHWYKS
jgi:hypothetical protein